MYSGDAHFIVEMYSRLWKENVKKRICFVSISYKTWLYLTFTFSHTNQYISNCIFCFYIINDSGYKLSDLTTWHAYLTEVKDVINRNVCMLLILSFSKWIYKCLFIQYSLLDIINDSVYNLSDLTTAQGSSELGKVTKDGMHGKAKRVLTENAIG